MTKIPCCIAFLLASAAVCAVDVVGTMRPNADLCVYFDTRQAEHDLAPDVWKRIQADKKEAAARNAGKKTFNTEGRDVVGCLNVDFLGFAPFRFRLDGLLNVSGGGNASAKRDVRDFSAAFREMGYEVVDGGTKACPTCKVDMRANDPLPDSGAELVSDDDGALRIRARWGLKEAEEPAEPKAEARLSVILSGQPVVGKSLVLVGDARTLSKLPLDDNEAQRALRRLLVKLDVFRVDVTARGDVLAFRAALLFKSEKDASAYRKDAESGSATLFGEASAGLFRNFSCGGHGLALEVSLDMDVMTAWNMLGRFGRQGGDRAVEGKKTSNSGR